MKELKEKKSKIGCGFVGVARNFVWWYCAEVGTSGQDFKHISSI